MPAAIQAVFEKNRDELMRRIATLDHAVTAVRAGGLDEDLRARAERDAHKLAGSLGMFGLASGSDLARELEQALATRPAISAVDRLAEIVLTLRAQLDGRRAEPPQHPDGVLRPPPTAHRASRTPRPRADGAADRENALELG